MIFVSESDFKEAGMHFITQQEERDRWLWKITANLWNKKPWQNTDDEITLRRWNACLERFFSWGQTDPQLCEIRRIFSSLALKRLSPNPGKHFITVATQLSRPNGPIGVRESGKRDTIFITQQDKD